MKGGNSFLGSLTKILAPTGINSLGSVVILVLLQEAFVNSKKGKMKSMKIQGKIIKRQAGGNPLKNLIAPLGTNAFIATGLLVVMEKLFVQKVKQIKTSDLKKKKMMGGKVNKKLNNLFNLVAPITFNAFTTKSSYNKITNKMSNL